MIATVAFLRVLPTAFLGRCAIAFVEVAVAAVILSGAVVIGHDLREWRAWYWDPATTHAWTAPAVASPVAEPSSR